MGWASKRNGELLTLAEGRFDVFLTVDQNLSFQNELHHYALAVVVLQAKTNKLTNLRSLVPELLSVLGTVAPGRVFRVGSRGQPRPPASRA